MSTSELRRGPGWWMDPEGQWNPPESWPESSPPLPGWVRHEDGRWGAPTGTNGNSSAPSNGTAVPPAAPVAPQRRADDHAVSKRPEPETPPQVPSLNTIRMAGSEEPVTTHRSTKEPALGFNESSTAAVTRTPIGQPSSRAVAAAAVAAITAAMIAAGLIVLLALL